MAAIALPGKLGVSLAQSHSCCTPNSANHFSNSSPTTPELALQVPLHLRSPKKPCTSRIYDKPQTIAPPKNPESGQMLASRANSQYEIAMKNNKYKNRKSGFTVAPACTISDVLHLMDALSVPTPPDLYASFIKECIVSADLCGADALHNHITRSGLRNCSLSLLNRLLLMHVSQNRVDVARELFDEMPSKDFKSWAVMIVAYVNRNNYQEALSMFQELLDDVSILDFPAWMMVCLLKTCFCTENIDLGKQVHGCCLKLGHVNTLYLGSCLVNFYGKFKCLENANLVFNQLPCHSTTTWMSRVSNHSREQLYFEVLKDFEEIGKAGIKKNAAMFSTVLKACGRIHDNGKFGRQVHADVIKLGFESDSYVQCTLVGMYGRSRFLGDARKVFENTAARRNNACWNAMLCGYIRNEFYIEAIRFINEMKAAGMQLNQSLLNELRNACGRTLFV